MLIVTIIMRLIHKSWLNPTAFYCLWWTFTIFFSLFIGGEENIPVEGLFWILISFILMGCGSLLFVEKKLNLENFISSENSDQIYRNNIYLQYIYSISLFFSFLYIILNLYYNDVNFRDFKSLEGIFLIAAKFTKERYEETTSLPLYIKIQLSFLFFSNSIGGFLYGLKKNKKYLICFIPPILISIVFTEKAGIFFCLSSWVASNFITRIIFQRIRIFSFKNFLSLLISCTFIIAIITVSSFARLGSFELSQLSIVKEKLYSGFGQVPAFANWFSSYQITDFSSEFGKFTFSGILDFLGLSKREIGLYSENYELSNGAYTNIYSIHKGIILDYSVIGAMVIYLIFGVMSSYFYIKVLRRNKKFISFLSITYFVIIGSIFTSIFVYNTIFLSCIFTILSFSLIKLKKV